MQNLVKLKNGCTKLIQNTGFTLVELLVALGLLGMIIGAIFTLFINLNYAFHAQNRISEAQQNVRFSLEKMVRYIRMAGYGVTSNIAMVSGDDGQYVGAYNATLAEPDSLTINASIGASTYTTEHHTVGDTTIYVNDTTGFEVGDDIYLLMPMFVVTSGEEGGKGKYKPHFIVKGKVTGLTADSISVLSWSYSNYWLDYPNIPQGTMVFHYPENIEFSIDTSGDRLMMVRTTIDPETLSPPATATATSIVLSENAEDLQFSYHLFDSSGAYTTWLNANPTTVTDVTVDSSDLQESHIRDVRIVDATVLLKTAEDPRYEDSDISEYSSLKEHNRAAFDLTAEGLLKRHRRYQVSSVRPRNLGK
jgi:prepilin-type N-terminal cleavage/methylation domain-containing protein